MKSVIKLIIIITIITFFFHVKKTLDSLVVMEIFVLD